MALERGWDDPTAAREWDAQADEINPTRAEQLDILASVLEGRVRAGDWILDLGAGSGKVESILFERIPGIRVVGVDSSSAMLDLARARLQPYGDRFLAVSGDVACLPQIALPTPTWRAVIAVQSLHHLSADEMRSVYGWVYAHLQPGGVFLLLDRLQVVSEVTFGLVRSVWLRLDRLHGTAGASTEGATLAEHRAALAEEGDRPQSLETHLEWLKSLGFEVVVLHLHGNRGLLAAVKQVFV